MVVEIEVKKGCHRQLRYLTNYVSTACGSAVRSGSHGHFTATVLQAHKQGNLNSMQSAMKRNIRIFSIIIRDTGYGLCFSSNVT